MGIWQEPRKLKTYLWEFEVDVDESYNAQCQEDKVVFIANGVKSQCSRRCCSDCNRIVRAICNGSAFRSEMCWPDFRDIHICCVIHERCPEEDVDEEESGSGVETWFKGGSKILFLKQCFDD